MSTKTKRFTTGQILSAMHGRLLCEIGELYEILNWMTGESLMTHQLPRASREAEPSLREQFPDLAALDVYEPEISNEADVVAYLASLPGDSERDVAPLAPEDHTVIDPLAEIKMMRPDMPILAIGADDTTEPTR